MYLFLGQTTVVRADDITGIFDMDSTTVQKATRDFLSASEKRSQVVNVSFELPKTFAVCGGRDNSKIYISPAAAGTLARRLADGQRE